MAIQRQAVDNPLALHPKENIPNRQLSVTGIQNPMQTAGNGEAQRMQEFFGVMNRLQGTVAEISDRNNERMITEGKLSYMSGATEAQMAAQGNRFSMQGWQSLNAVDQANTLYLNELSDMEKMQHLPPEQYQKRMMERRAEYLKNLPDDPAVRKMFAAAFEDVGPRLAGQHMQAHNAWNQGEMERSFSNALSSGSVANADHSTARSGNVSLKLSDAIVDTPYQGDDNDRHIGILTMLGEAGAEGDLGMAAVAHVMKNRTRDGRWGGSIASVAQAPKQFSTWNKGAGGNNPAGRFKPGTALYNRAAAVYDAVMSGKHVDPTGGATHFYSPAGMRKLVNDGDQSNILPRWLENEKRRSGGEIKIGGHIFVGRASGSAVRREPLPAPTDGAAEGASEFSGFLGPDIAFAPDPSERVQGAHQDNQIYSPANSDLEVQPGVPSQDVAEAQEIPVQPGATAQTQIQELIRGFEGVPRARKAALLSDAIRRQLEDGDDSLFHDAGGYAMLNELGASSSDIDRVRAAHAKFKSKDDDKFDVNEERWRQSILDRAAEGDPTVMDEIEERANDGSLDGKTASALYRTVATALAKVGDTAWANNPDAQERIVGVSQFIKDGGDIKDAVERLREIEDEFDIPRDAATRLVDQMFSTWEQQKDRLRTETQRQLEKHQANEAAKAQVDMALSRGYGLNDVSGNVTIAGDDGNKREVSAKQYGIERLQMSEFQNMKQMVKEGMNEDDARAVAEANIYSQLRKHDVVDERMSNYLNAGLTGNILGEGGKVTEDATRAFEFYLRMSENPDVGEAYMSKMVSDPGARALVETARNMYAGRYNIEDSLKKAHAALNDPNVDVNAKIAKDGVFTGAMNERISNMLDTQHGRTMWGRIFGDWGFASSDIKAIEQEAFRAGSPIRKEIERAAQAHYVANPRIPPDVAVRLASQDVAKNVDFVAGNIVIGNAAQGRKLSQVMGLAGEDSPRLVEDAVDYMLMETGKELFGDLFETEGKSRFWDTARRLGHTATFGVFSGEGFNFRPDAKSRVIPEYNLTYNQQTGQIGIQLYESADGVTRGPREVLKGPIRWFDAAQVGTRFREAMKMGEFYEPNIFMKGVNKFMKDMGENTQRMNPDRFGDIKPTQIPGLKVPVQE